jgi:hypothetical protein
VLCYLYLSLSLSKIGLGRAEQHSTFCVHVFGCFDSTVQLPGATLACLGFRIYLAPCTDFEVRYCRHHRRLHQQFSLSKLCIVCTFNASSRSIEMMEMAVHTLCFTHLNYSTINCSLSSVQCGRLCQVEVALTFGVF